MTRTRSDAGPPASLYGKSSGSACTSHAAHVNTYKCLDIVGTKLCEFTVHQYPMQRFFLLLRNIFLTSMHYKTVRWAWQSIPVLQLPPVQAGGVGGSVESTNEEASRPRPRSLAARVESRVIQVKEDNGVESTLRAAEKILRQRRRCVDLAIGSVLAFFRVHHELHAVRFKPMLLFIYSLAQGSHWKMGELREKFRQREPVPDSRVRMLPEKKRA